MPKTTLTFDSEDKIPAELKPFAKDLKVEVWFNANDLAVAGELNPQLDAHNKRIIEEKRVIEEKVKTAETERDALKSVASNDNLDKAKLVVEVESLKRQLPNQEDAQLLSTVKTAFGNASPSEISTKIPTLLEASGKAEKYEKRELQKQLFQVSGFKNETVFLDFINNPENLQGIEGEIYAETIAGSDKKGLFVKVKDANNVPQPKLFNDYLKESPKGAAYLPALLNGTGATENQQWFQQNPNLDGQGDKGVKPAWQQRVEDANKKAAEKPNPFAPNSTINQQVQGGTQT